MPIKVIDNYLNVDDHQQILNVLSNADFPWYFSKVLSEKDIATSLLSEKDNYQFGHLFYFNYNFKSDYSYVLNPILNKINPLALIRIKSNLNTRTETIIEHGYHIDIANATTAIYYVNTNNGYTLFEDGTKIESIANRFVQFDSNLLHTGSTTTDQSARIVINFNYIKYG